MKKLLQPKSTQYDKAPNLDKQLVYEYIELENKQLQMKAEIEKIWKRQKEIKNELQKQLPGEVYDKYNLNVDGILIKKSFQDKSSINEEKAVEFARGRRMLSKVAEKKWVIDKKALEKEIEELLNNGKVKKEDLMELINPKYIPTLVLDDTRPSVIEEDGKINLAAQ